MAAIKETYKLRPATLADVEAVNEVLNAASRKYIGVDNSTAEEVRREWTSPDFKLDESVRLAVTPDDRIVGMMEVWDNNPNPVRIFTWCRVHPDYENQGIGTALMDWAEARARQALPRVAEDLRVVLEAGTVSTNTAAADLLTTQGMTLIRHFWTMKIEMDAAPPEPVWPEGITVRAMRRGAEERAVLEAVNDAFRDHWGFVEQPIDDTLKEWRHYMANDAKFDPDLWFLALAGDEIAGISLCEPYTNEDPDMGYVMELGVRRPWRRRGVALALLQHSFGELWRRGRHKVSLGVDASSLTGATRLYEKAGMHVSRQFDVYEKELRPGHNIATTTL